MTKYITRAAYIGADEGGQPIVTADTVFVEDDGPRDTGLIDHAGNRIYRESSRAPLGFGMKMPK